MSSDWKASTLGEFVRLQRGHDLTSTEQRQGPFPVMGSAGPNGTHAEFKANGPGVVIGRSGSSMGRSHFVESQYWPHNTCLYVTDFFGNSERFAYYLLSTLDLASFNSGSAQPSLNRNYIYSMPIQVPSRKVQDEIVELLGSIDDQITLLRETNETLEAIAQAIFKSWFVDFDPVKAKAQGLDPAGMDEKTAAFFPDHLVESSIGEVPSGWKVLKIGAVLSSKSERVGDRSIPEYSSTNDGLVPRSKIFNKKLSESNSNNKVVFKGDLVFGLSRKVLNFGQMNDAIGCVSPAYKVYAVSSDDIDPALLGTLMRVRSNYFYNAVSASSREGQSVSDSALWMLEFCCPPKSLQKRYIDVMSTINEMMLLNEEEIKTLSELRDTLLPRLISGKLKLPETLEAPEIKMAVEMA